MRVHHLRVHFGLSKLSFGRSYPSKFGASEWGTICHLKEIICADKIRILYSEIIASGWLEELRRFQTLQMPKSRGRLYLQETPVQAPPR